MKKDIVQMSENIHNLLEGSKQFQKPYFAIDRILFDNLVAQGQEPKTMIVACSDSRVDPAVIFHCQPGQLFVVRNIANLVPPAKQTIVIMGAVRCLSLVFDFWMLSILLCLAIPSVVASVHCLNMVTIPTVLVKALLCAGWILRVKDMTI